MCLFNPGEWRHNFQFIFVRMYVSIKLSFLLFQSTLWIFCFNKNSVFCYCITVQTAAKESFIWKRIEGVGQTRKKKKRNKTSASARRISDKRGGGQLQLCATLPFSMATFPSFIACLYFDWMDREWYLRQASKYNYGLLWLWLLPPDTRGRLLMPCPGRRFMQI